MTRMMQCDDSLLSCIPLWYNKKFLKMSLNSGIIDDQMLESEEPAQCSWQHVPAPLACITSTDNAAKLELPVMTCIYSCDSI